MAVPRTGDPFELDADDISVGFDASWSPYVQAQFTAKIIEDQAQIDRLNPNYGCRVKVYAGYVYDGMQNDMQLLADLHLRSCIVSRPDNVMKIVAESDDRLTYDYKRLSWHAQAPTTGINAFVKHHADIAALPGTATVLSDFPTVYGASALAGLVQEPGQASADMLNEASQRLGVRIFCDENRVWHIQSPDALKSVTSLKLFTGPESTLLSAETARNRGEGNDDGFKNSAVIKYSWTDGAGNEQVIYGNANVVTGAESVYSIGYMTAYEERDFPTTQGNADSAASTLVAGRMSRGQTVSVVAVSAYWLRPGMTVTVQLPIGTQQRYIVTGVNFSSTSGVMSLSLRQPMTAVISTTA
jgi:hypothetical protein